MNKYFYLVLIVLISINSYSQITITQTDMPNVNDTFRLSTTNIFNFNSNDTGEDYTWDFASLNPNSQSIDTFVGVLSTPVVYNVVFNNILDQNRATIAKKNPNSPSFIQQVQVTESYDFFKESSTGFSKVGFGAKINDIPTPVKYDNPEKYLKFPLTYNTVDSSISKFGIDVPTFGHFGQTINRVNIADGWGAITTPYGTFDVIRVKSIINIRDTIYYQNYSFGTSINRPTEYEYKWIAKNKGLPILSIYVRNMTNSVTYLDSIRGNLVSINNLKIDNNIIVYPNPISENFKVISKNNISKIEIYSFNMSLVYCLSSINDKEINININEFDISTGIYFIKITDKYFNIYIKKLIVN